MKNQPETTSKIKKILYIHEYNLKDRNEMYIAGIHMTQDKFGFAVFFGRANAHAPIYKLLFFSVCLPVRLVIVSF